MTNAAPQTPLRVALLGCGVVGSEVARVITQQSEDLTARIGRPLELTGIAVRRTGIERPGLDPALFTTDAESLVARDDVDLVVELIGGIEPARSLILTALRGGASVVTANKALLAEDGATLFAAAEQAGVDLYFEASVAGAIPIIRPLRESLVGDEITAVMGIVNGTTNFILDKMHTESAGFDDVLAEAQSLGYAEADPTADVEGFDAAAKAAILASLAFHSRVTAADVHREGITEISQSDVAAAEAMDCTVKALAICRLEPGEDGEQTISVRTHPAMIPNSHPLASVGGAYNAVFVESRNAGRLMFYGPGAGGAPTASAVLGDLVTVARNRVRGAAGPGESNYAQRPVVPIGQVATRYFLSLEVNDQAGVLAEIANCFATHQVSVQTLRQESSPRPGREGARLVVVTHTADDAALSATVAALRELPVVHEVLSVMRVEGE
ncbi:homoserine dehydrogenase [Enemella evansiae]|uniref:Homoserine dehydrogenase n=1 Tax=Enemella evansiae TaxID=2016499 RepID=A0A255GEW7_9ACTN|nr:homoserine dehydrogenase [Enemella evansiae]PFG67547.1 homoserine dehydrogenase [Propionibacteriaceae bacterium ES.041]OYN98941.1 homoserine dehydrogenase [Enemella evansiae]OYO01255.1 homoserine dehydrogenase [Enemella evansiae]OYO05033.1 homoserine dehydrogenase [Enemella evansiae]OYO07494.1 homoserine dehydrogenase [Enemella evansiae]